MFIIILLYLIFNKVIHQRDVAQRLVECEKKLFINETSFKKFLLKLIGQKHLLHSNGTVNFCLQIFSPLAVYNVDSSFVGEDFEKTDEEKECLSLVNDFIQTATSEMVKQKTAICRHCISFEH